MKLSGRFTLGSFSKTFLTVWLGFTIFWTCVATRPLLAGDTRFWWFPLAGLGFFAFGVIYVWFGRWCWRGDILWLSNLIEDALSSRPSTSINDQSEAHLSPAISLASCRTG